MLFSIYRAQSGKTQNMIFVDVALLRLLKYHLLGLQFLVFAHQGIITSQICIITDVTLGEYTL